jgi:hypothetical protein
MQKNLLWETLSAFSKTELRDFDRFVRSPYFNQKAACTLLFEHLYTCLREKQVPEPTGAFAAVWPEDGYNDQKMRLLNSDLLRLTEEFQTAQVVLAQQNRRAIALSAQYRQRNLAKHHRIALREARQALSAYTWRNAEYFDELGELEMEQYRFAASVKRFEEFNLQEISDLMDVAFIARKLRHACFTLSHQAVFKKQYHLGMLESVLQHIEREAATLLHYPAVALYYHACRFLAGQNGELHFEQFRLLLTETAHLFPEDEIRALYLLAINFGVKKSNEYGQAWLRATFELYKEGLARRLLLENGFLSRFAYNNIVGIAMRLGEADWAESFLLTYKPLLERRYREASFSLNSARVAYMRQRYGLALQYLQNADYKDFINSMNAKILQMKIYYETDEVELLISHLDSLQNYIRRQGPVGYHRENYLRIVRYVRQLVRTAPATRKSLSQLEQKIQSESILLTEKEWLLRCIAQQRNDTGRANGLARESGEAL